MRYPALIFDFDGTIADTLSEGTRVYNQLARESGFVEVHKDDFHELRSLDTKHLLHRLKIPKRKVPMLLVKGRALIKESIRDVPLIAGMEEILPRLRERAKFFGILTSNATENVEAFLDSHGLRHLFTFISSTSKLTGKSKHLRSIARTFSLESSEMLYVGDEIRDVRAARKAKIAAGAVCWGLNSKESLIAENPRHLAEIPADLVKICTLPGA
jgi:phosphoglycolate phosphatase